MEYYEYFRLKGAPFQPASPNTPVYFSPTHLEALTTLESGLLGELTGLTLLTGEAGTGKTTLINAMLHRDYKRVRIAHIDDPKLSFMEMMRVVLPQLKLYTAGETKLDYLNTLDHLLELHGQEERIAIVVDEAQLTSDEVLEELRLLSNRGQRSDRCLQLILVGQPELAERLKKPELRQLNQRISSRGVLKPLEARQAAMYVEFMISSQGGKCDAIFERGALDRLIWRSDGLPRKINMLCHSAMLAAFYSGERRVSFRTAKKTAIEYQDSVGIKNRRFNRRFAPVASATFAALLMLAFFSPTWWSDWVLDHVVPSGDSSEQTIRPASRATRHQKNSATLRVAKAASATTPHPVESGPPVAPGTAASATPNSAAAAPAMAPGSAVVGPPKAVAMPIAPISPALSVESQKQTGVPAARERPSQITVRYGDTLEKIAIRYFGSNAGINLLIEANPNLTNINQLNVGQIINLPDGLSSKTSPDQTATAPTVVNAENSPRQ